MDASKTELDFSGARGSNTGDQFHEMWSLQQTLELLNFKTNLSAVSVEGVMAKTATRSSNDHTWDGVDCTLYFGGESLDTADEIEFIQLKYSASDSDKEWTTARLTYSSARTKNNSIIRKMADDFKDANKHIKQNAKIKIRFISNQKLSSEAKKVLDSRWIGPLEKANFEKTLVTDLKFLKKAAGLPESDFQDFLNVLDFSECGYNSRFAMKEKVVQTMTTLLGDDVFPEVHDLQIRIRELMLPERAGEIITHKDILLWFGLSGYEGLFPCPIDIQTPEYIVERPAAIEVVKKLIEGNRIILIHGSGGCGKTTLMHQISSRLPENSVMITFDCFGGGRYIYSDDKRHLPENAFLQLSNDLAVSLNIPLFIPRSRKYPATIRRFMAKLRLAGEVLEQYSPKAILLIAIDAADNSVFAAKNDDPPERPFIYDLFNANLSELPGNIRVVVSCRTDTDRLKSLKLPPNTEEVICPLFSLDETKHHLMSTFDKLSDSVVEQFHSLSNKNPRVQSYAIAMSKGDPNKLLESLMPGGKSLVDVLQASFDNALKKLVMFKSVRTSHIPLT